MHHPQSLRRYQTAIRFLSGGRYGNLTDRERQALIRVLRTERQHVLRRMAAAQDDAGPSRDRESNTPQSHSLG